MDLITTSKACEILQVSQQTFYKMKKQYQSFFKEYMGEGRNNLYKQEDILLFKSLPKKERSRKKRYQQED